MTWTSSDPSVATVDANGLVTAVSPGTATITATADGVSATCTVTVTRPYTPPANPNYRIDITDTANGIVIADPTSAKAGTTVTLTPVPDEGYALGSLAVTDRFGDPVALTEQADGTYTFTMPNGQVTVTATFVETEAPVGEPFLDVNEGDWFYDAVQDAVDMGLMAGVSADRFDPKGTVTRAMVAQILYAREGKPTVSGAAAISDVPANAWFHNAMQWAKGQGVIAGYPDGRMDPNAPVTREQLAVILHSYAQKKGMNVSKTADLSGYADSAAVSVWAKDAMSWAVGSGLISGRSASTLAPAGSATRAECAVIFTQMFQK